MEALNLKEPTAYGLYEDFDYVKNAMRYCHVRFRLWAALAQDYTMLCETPSIPLDNP